MTRNSRLKYIIDLDGTIYRGMDPIPYAGELLQYLEENKRDYLLATNCPRNTPDSLVKKLSGMGIKVGHERIMTSGQVAASYIAENFPGAVVYLIGTYHLRDELSSLGIKIGCRNSDVVLVGYDTDFNYEKMKTAVKLINKGAKFICTNGDVTIPEGSEVVPHTGAIAAGITAATGIMPVNLGKPESYFLDEAVRRLNCSKEECCILGDRLDTDILAGVRYGIKSFLVLTGVTDRKQLEESRIKPDLVFENLKELIEYDVKYVR